MIAYGYTGGPRMVWEALFVFAALCVVFGLGWWAGRVSQRENRARVRDNGGDNYSKRRRPDLMRDRPTPNPLDRRGLRE